VKISCFQNMDKMKTNLTKVAVVDHWQVLRIDPQKLKADATNLHQAAQLIAMAGTSASEQAGLTLLFLSQAIDNALKMVGNDQEI